jgi:hypothetical protein
MGLCNYLIVPSSRTSNEPEALAVAVSFTPELGNIAVGAHIIPVTIKNNTTEPKHIYGANGICAKNVCCKLRADRDYSRVIAVNGLEACVMEIEIDVREPGPFEAPFCLYVENNGMQKLEITMSGVGVSIK